MWGREIEAHRQRLVDDVMTGMKEWRLQHPRATFQEIESALDEELARVRARMLQDTALASRAAKVSEDYGGERPECPECGRAMEHETFGRLATVETYRRGTPTAGRSVRSTMGRSGS